MLNTQNQTHQLQTIPLNLLNPPTIPLRQLIWSPYFA